MGAEKNVTDLNELPYFVSIQTREYGNWIHYCSGAIYDGYTVITSAECRVDLLDRVVAGKSKLGDTEIGEQVRLNNSPVITKRDKLLQRIFEP